MRAPIRLLMLGLLVLLLAAPTLRAQDLSKYRGFSLGTDLASVLKLTSREAADVTVTHAAPTLFQELSWWPPSLVEPSSSLNNVQQILFSFYDGELYKMSVVYDQASTEGLTAEDMVKSISAEYGPPTVVTSSADASPGRYDPKQKPLATWEDSRYSFNLIRSSFSDRFGLVIYSKSLDAKAQVAVVEAVKLEEQQGPQKEAERQKKQMDDLEAVRKKNQKTFRP